MNNFVRHIGWKLGIIILGIALSRASAQEQQHSSALPAPITYRLECADPMTHRLHVEIGLDTDQQGKIAFAIPAWTPGYYQILHYESSIAHVTAQDQEGHALEITHPIPREWDLDLSHPVGHLTFSYDVQAQDDGLGFFGSMLDGAAKLGYVNGASALMYIANHKDLPAALTITAPAGWKIACPLAESDVTDGATDSTHSIATYHARDYDELIDSPIQLGNFDEISFRTDNIGFRCLLVGKTGTNRARLADVLRRIAHAEISLFGGAPFKQYVFFFHSGGAGFAGGLEHRNSTVIHLFRPIGDGSDDTFQEVASHEMFHAWNVKHLHPYGLGPFDYTTQVRTGSLWWAEGVTDYYAEVILVRAGLRSRGWFLDVMAGRIAMLDNTPSRAFVSVDTASKKAWEGQSEGFDGLSYYLKGSLVGFYLDLKIRAVTGGNRSLDDVIRDLDADYGNRGVGYPEDALEKAVETVANASFKSDFDRYIYGTDEIDWKSVLPPAGFTLERTKRGFLGVGVSDELSSVAVIADISHDSPAEQIGLRKGDRIRDINSVRVTGRNFASVVQSCIPMTRITVLLDRGNHRLSLSGTIGVRYTDQKITTVPDNQLSEASHRIRDAFLSTEARSERRDQHSSRGTHLYKS